MAVTSITSELGRVCGVLIRARTLTQGVFDIVVGERGLVLIPLWGPDRPLPAAVLLGGFQGGAIGHRRGGDSDARRRSEYLASTADGLARNYFSHRAVRRAEVVRSQVWDHRGSGKLRLELTDGTNFTFRWEKRANRDVDAARLVVDALGPAVELRH
jgi:hypothetical protein